MKIVMTSAWNPIIPKSEAVLAERRNRLLASLDFYRKFEQINQIILLDSTLLPQDREQLLTSNVEILHVPILKTNPVGEYRGPSYLESLLYAQYHPDFDADKDFVFKITGGYLVRNFAAILQRVSELRLSAMGFLIQPPLDLRMHYALTGCLGLRGDYFASFLRFASSRSEELRTEPLERIYCTFLRGLGGKRGARIPYPDIDAYFSTSGFTDKDSRYRNQYYGWRFFAALGLNTISLRNR